MWLNLEGVSHYRRDYGFGTIIAMSKLWKICFLFVTSFSRSYCKYLLKYLGSVLNFKTIVIEITEWFSISKFNRKSYNCMYRFIDFFCDFLSQIFVWCYRLYVNIFRNYLKLLMEINISSFFETCTIEYKHVKQVKNHYYAS